MRMRAYATGQYINEGFGVFVGLREFNIDSISPP